MNDERGELPAYRWEHVPADMPRAVLEAMGGEEANRLPPGEEPVRVVRAAARVAWPHRGELLLEDGRRRIVEDALPPDLPLGYHEFHPAHGRSTTRVIVTPGACSRPARRQWGWGAQVYGVRSRESWGIGDLADLRRLTQWMAGLEAGLVLINPLTAASPGSPQTPSPYQASSRRFRNPLYLRIEEVPGAERLGPEIQRLSAAGRALNHDRLLDRDRVFQLKDEALRAIWRGFQHDAAFDRFRQAQGTALVEFATYSALADHFGGDWREWPAEYRHPGGTAVRDFARQYAEGIRYHEWLQWLLDEQLARASRALPIVHDLPIGMGPGGADAWIWQDLLAGNMSVGAPPDAFSIAGQDWSLPPFVPSKLRAARCEPFIQTIRATLRHAGGLRIDHVMGLFRLFWIPRGGSPSEGAYVRYPADDLLGILALESQRAGAFVVGEDLGTVEPGVREHLAHWNVLSFRVLYFEERPPRDYPRLSMAAVTTHDLPTIAGLWSGSDLAAQRQRGMPVNDEPIALRGRFADILGLCDRAAPATVIQRAYETLSQAPSLLLLATLEDALAVHERPNMPNTVDKWPNWSLALPVPLEALETSTLPRHIAARLCRAVSEAGQGADTPCGDPPRR